MFQADVLKHKLHTSGRINATERTQLPQGDHATARLHRDWLRRVSESTGLPPTTLAKKIKISPSTLTRPLAEGDEGTSTLHAATIDKIVAFTGIAPPAAAAPLGRPLRGFREDASPFTFDKADPLTSAVKALIAGRNGIDPWTIKSRALELAGYLPGDIVLVDLNATPRPGDAVCAQVYDWPKMKADTVMRMFQRAAPVDVLLGRSLDPAFDQPLVIDGERVLVKGVLLPHRLRQQAAA